MIDVGNLICRKAVIPYQILQQALVTYTVLSAARDEHNAASLDVVFDHVHVDSAHATDDVPRLGLPVSVWSKVSAS